MLKRLFSLLQSSVRFQMVFIFAASILCYLNSLECGFVYDDPMAIIRNEDLKPTTPISQLFVHDFWGRSMTNDLSHGSYRPLCVLTFRWNYQFWELEPKSYHLVNVVLHAVVSVLIYWCLQVLSFSRLTIFISATLFAIHPIHTDAVTGVVGRAELLSGIFFFIALISYVLATKKRGFTKVTLLFITAVSVPLATLCKESGITVVGLLFIYELVVQNKWKPNIDVESLRILLNIGSVLRLGAVATATFAFLHTRFKIMPKMPKFSIATNPAAAAATPIRQMTFAYLLPLNTKLILYPWDLDIDWTHGSLPLIEGFHDGRNLITLLFFVAAFTAVYITARNVDHHILLSLAFIVIPFIPASNLFFAVGFVIAERVLYLSSLGFCSLVALGFERVLQSTKRIHYARFILSSTIAILLILFFCRSVTRNFDWKDNITISRSGIRVHPNNAKHYNLVGAGYLENKQYHEAIAYLYKALRLHPYFKQCHAAIAASFSYLNQTDWMERALRRFVIFVLDPKYPPIENDMKCSLLTDLAYVIANNENATFSKLVEAENLLQMVQQIEPHYLAGYERRGEILFRLRRYDDAKNVFKTVMEETRGKCPNCYYNLAAINLTQQHLEVEQIESALQSFEKTIRYIPNHYFAMYSYASLVLEWQMQTYYEQAGRYAKRVVEAEIRLDWNVTRHDLFILLPESVVKRRNAAYIAAFFAAEAGNFSESLDFLQLAVKREPKSKEVLLKLSWLLYRDLARASESLPYVETLVETHPNTTNAWLLLGYLQLQHRNDVEKARKAFETAISVAGVDDSEPTNIISSSSEAARKALCRLGIRDKSINCSDMDLEKSKQVDSEKPGK